jgi:hypothetical protein
LFNSSFLVFVFFVSQSKHTIAIPPSEQGRTSDTRQRSHQAQLDDAPDPQGADGRRALHHGVVAAVIRQIDEVAAGNVGGDDKGKLLGKLCGGADGGRSDGWGGDGVAVRGVDEEG